MGEGGGIHVSFLISIYVGGVARQRLQLKVQGVGLLGLHLFTGYSLRGLRDDFRLKG